MIDPILATIILAIIDLILFLILLYVAYRG